MLRFSGAVLFLILNAWAQQAATPDRLLVRPTQTIEPSSHDSLKPLEYLVGGTWVADGEYPRMGHYSAERTYHWVLNQSFIEQSNLIKLADTQIEARRIFGWDSQKKKIVVWGFGDDGGVASAEAAASDVEVAFEGTRSSSVGVNPLRFTLKKLTENEFTENTEAKKDGDWKPLMTFHFTRK
jgi:hypothetical protein